MKGYVIIALTVSVLLLMMPLVLLTPTQSVVQNHVESSVTVCHSDGSGKSTMSLYDMTMYETACKMPIDAPNEAIKAQLVAEYTLLQYQQALSGEIKNTSMSFPSSYNTSFWQSTWGDHFQENDHRFRGLLNEVYGKRIVYEGQPIMALSHIMNSGQTENGELLLGQRLPYFQEVASPADALCPNRLTTVTVTQEDMATYIQSLIGSAPSGTPDTWIGEAFKTTAGTVESITLTGTKVKGYDIATAFALPSAAFEVVYEQERFIFTVCGSGHFVGMSANGAIAMAKDGRNYEEILKHYYRGTTIA